MASWLSEGLALGAAVLVVFGPGLLVGAALRLRGSALWALAPAIGTAVLTGCALLLGLIGIGWTPLPAAIALIVVAGAAWGVRVLLRLPAVPAPAAVGWTRRLLLVGVVVGVVLVALRVGFYIGDARAISQTNDAAFHLNALRFAVETGAASPLELSSMTGASSFYPSAWHVLASLVAQLSGAPVEVAANVVTLVLAAGAWTLGIAYLTKAVAGPVAAAIAAALAASVSAFPLLLVQWGVLYPQLLATAVLPAAIAVIADSRGLLGRADADARPWARVLRFVVILSLALAAILTAQPSVALAWAVAALALGAWGLVAGWTRWTPRVRALSLAGVVAGGVVTVVVWWLFARSTSVTWAPTAGKTTAALETVMNGFLGYPWAVLTSILMIIGIIAAIRMPRLRGLATTWVVLAGLYFVAAAIASPTIRGLLVGPWYEDPYRLAALVPVAAIPLAGAGAAALVAWAGSALAPAADRRERASRRAASTAVAVVAAVGVISLVVSPQIARRDVFVHRIDPNLYTVSADSFLSADELTVLRRLDETVPEDAVVIGNPSTGMSFGYALSGRNVIPRSWSPPSGLAYSTLWGSLRDVATNPEVCPALDAFGAEYVLDFGPGEQYPGRWIMPGFTDIDGQPGFELVDREGDASLWRVTACG